jgi:hypothetical protein
MVRLAGVCVCEFSQLQQAAPFAVIDDSTPADFRIRFNQVCSISPVSLLEASLYRTY